MFKIAIVEDDKKAYLVLKDYLDRYSKEKDVTFVIEYFRDAINFISDYQCNFDLIFMDIMMPELDGMKAAERLRKIDKKVVLIFVTNMALYAAQGYNVFARYFMVKPILYKDFAMKLENTLLYIVNEFRNRKSIMLHLPFDEIRKIFVKDIKYIEVFDHELVIHLYDEDIRMRGRLSDFEKELDPVQFCRVNSCYIVNLECVKAVKDRIIYLDNVELSVSHARRKKLIKALSDFVAKED